MGKIVIKPLENFLINKGFKIHSKHLTNVRYILEIDSFGKVYVRSLDDRLLEVEYQHIARSKTELGGEVVLYTIDTIERLELFLNAVVK
jgi:hypothetical protein